MSGLAMKWVPVPMEEGQILHDLLVVGSVQRFCEDGPCYATVGDRRLGAMSTDTSAREAVEAIARNATHVPLASATPADVGEEPVAWRTRGMNALSHWMPWVMVSRVDAQRWREDPSYKNGRREIEPLYPATALERVTRERDHWAGEARRLLKSGQDVLDRAESAEAKLAEALAALDAETEVKVTTLTRPIIGIENRTAQEAFDIMCDRIRSALVPPESRS